MKNFNFQLPLDEIDKIIEEFDDNGSQSNNTYRDGEHSGDKSNEINFQADPKRPLMAGGLGIIFESNKQSSMGSSKLSDSPKFGNSKVSSS